MEDVVVLSNNYSHSSEAGLNNVDFEIGFGGADFIAIQLNKNVEETSDTVEIKRPSDISSNKISIIIYTRSQVDHHKVKTLGTLEICSNGGELSSVFFTLGIQREILFVFLKSNSRFSIEYKPSKQNYLLELENMIGLKAVKRQVDMHLAYMTAQRKRKEVGLPEVNVSKHLIFLGNPGTGKTTVARLIGSIYHEEGVCTNNKVIEVDRSNLVGGYVGQTALKTSEVLNRALGGVLFIDEAYSLMPHEENSIDFGKEAIDTIIKFMEDHRDEIVVIAAGYEDDMQNFLKSNPGLASRFKTTIIFEDYNPEELMCIFQKLCTENCYEVDFDASQMIGNHFKCISEGRTKGFANGREVRNFFETCIQRQAMRIAHIENPTREQLSVILSVDVLV